MLEKAIASGLLSMRADPILLGEIPTPGVAYITKEFDADAGIMISASHNPYEYNGFKIFSDKGYKLMDEEELQIENLIFSDVTPISFESKFDLGEEEHAYEELGMRYLSFLQHTLAEKTTFKDM